MLLTGLNQVNRAAVAVASFVDMVRPKIEAWAASVVPVVKAVALEIADFALSLVAFARSDTLSEWATTILGALSPVKAAIGSFVAGLGVFFRNFDSIVALTRINVTEGLANLIIGAEAWASDFVTVAQWLRENWFKTLVDINNGFQVFALNLLNNAARLGVALWDAIQGRGFHFEFKPLLEGFKSAVDKLPALARPVWVDMSKERQAEMDKIDATEAQHVKDRAALARDINQTEIAGEAKAREELAKSDPAKAAAEKDRTARFTDLVEFAKSLQTGAFSKKGAGALVKPGEHAKAGALKPPGAGLASVPPTSSPLGIGAVPAGKDAALAATETTAKNTGDANEHARRQTELLAAILGALNRAGLFGSPA